MFNEFSKENYDRDTIEIKDKGFIVFNAYCDESCYIHILYVKPEFRSDGIGKQLEQMVIDEYKPKTLYSYVDLTSSNPEIALRAIMGVGYKIESSSATSIVLKKELEK